MFNENWYSDSQLISLRKIAKKAKGLEGRWIEIGCWEGKSTVAIANEIYPEKLDAVDTWKGSMYEASDHISVKIALGRDVFSIFCNNVSCLTKGNVIPYKQDCFEYLAEHDTLIKFCHIDASHDYDSVKRTIQSLLPRLVPGGILCGDDYLSANINRTDLNGGVQRAVIEILPCHKHIDNFWWYRHSFVNRFINSLLSKFHPSR